MKKILYLLFSFLLLASCSNSEEGESSKPLIVCTTGMLADAVQHFVGDSAEVIALMGPGVDPHLYKPSQGDIAKLSRAQTIVYNGLHLEGKMGDILKKLGRTKSVIAAGNQLEEEQLINSTDFQGAHDPHLWFDVKLWNLAMKGISQELVKQYPNWSQAINNKQKDYSEKLLQLHEECIKEYRKIPDNQRVMITAHDAFKYLGRAYNLKVRGLQGISTTAEIGIRDVSDLVSFITDNKIKAIFVESSVPPRSIEAVIEGCEARGHQLKLGGELFSDAMGRAGTEEGTYQGMVRHNLTTIVSALR